jgi:hypothetical protein
VSSNQQLLLIGGALVVVVLLWRSQSAAAAPRPIDQNALANAQAVTAVSAAITGIGADIAHLFGHAGNTPANTSGSNAGGGGGNGISLPSDVFTPMVPGGGSAAGGAGLFT